MPGEIESASALPLRFAEGLADILVEIGLDGIVTFVSRSAGAILGRSYGDLVGRPAMELIHPQDRAPLYRRFTRAGRGVAAASSAAVEFRARHGDGRWIWLEGNPARILDPATRQPTGWVDILRDITVRKAQESEAAAARHAAEAEAAARSEFLANMSHEIRTPLNSIIGFMQVLKRDDSLGAVQLGHVSRVEEAGRSLLTMVNEVLDLSKIESGAIRLNTRPFSPAHLARDAAALIRPQAADKGLALVVEVAPEAENAVVGDPDRLRQVLLNLLSNAVKFTFAGEVALRLGMREAEPDRILEVVVEDSGMGISPEQIPNLFRRFTQADGSIARRFGGTGLGLAISKRLTEAMGGSIAVESTVGVGARFTVSVALPPAAARSGLSTIATPLVTADSAAAHGRRLLVAEDVPVNQKLVEAMLAPLGYTIDMVADGAQALLAVQRQDYALVLMDMQMPVLDGVEAARAIRGLGGRYASLPIIALTANVFPEQIERAREAGMNGVVTKPIESDHLLATVAKWAAA